MTQRPLGPREPVSAPVRALWPTAPEQLIGHTLAERYRLGPPIGSGGMGTVYLAEHVLIKKRVAIKVLGPEHSEKRSEVERFLGEAQAASRIRHQHVVDITDFGTTSEGLVFLVMEHLEGEDLATTCEREGVLPWRRAAAIVIQICAALAAAHAQGVIHRDMKPENCFRLSRNDEPDFIKVLDFGIAKVIDEHDAERTTSSGSGLLGTPEYVAPELIRGHKADARVDIYAVGVIFYRLLAGRVPFYGESYMSTLTAHLMELPKPPSQVVPDAGIPHVIENIVLRALAKDPDQRYPKIAALSAALKAALAEDSALPLVTAQPPRSRGIHPRVVLAVVVALIVSFAAVLWYVVEAPGTKDQVMIAEPEPPPPVEPPAPPIVIAAPVVAPVAVEAPVAVAEPLVVEAPAVPVVEAPAVPVVEAPVVAVAEKRPRGGQERLPADEFAAGMAKVAPRVKLECSRFSLRKMEVTVTATVGADGRVKRAEPTGSQAGSTLGNCVARVVKTALLRPTRAKSSHRHTFTM